MHQTPGRQLMQASLNAVGISNISYNIVLLVSMYCIFRQAKHARNGLNDFLIIQYFKAGLAILIFTHRGRERQLKLQSDRSVSEQLFVSEI
jgi:hypothetical protein